MFALRVLIAAWHTTCSSQSFVTAASVSVHQPPSLRKPLAALRACAECLHQPGISSAHRAWFGNTTLHRRSRRLFSHSVRQAHGHFAALVCARLRSHRLREMPAHMYTCLHTRISLSANRIRASCFPLQPACGTRSETARFLAYSLFRRAAASSDRNEILQSLLT